MLVRCICLASARTLKKVLSHKEEEERLLKKRGELGNQPDHMCACESSSPSSEDPRRKEVLGNQPDDRHICLASARTLEKGLSHKEGATDTL